MRAKVRYKPNGTAAVVINGRVAATYNNIPAAEEAARRHNAMEQEALNDAQR